MNHTTLPTPVGPFTVVVDPDGAVVAAGFTTDPGQLPPHAGGQTAGPAPEDGPAAGLRRAVEAVTAYLDGDLTALAAVPVRTPSVGGPVLPAAWQALRRLPPGRPVTYTALAAAAGRPTAVRTAASACARNPVALFVPCHRVVRADGGLGGYRWGLPVKQWLLTHERRQPGYSDSAVAAATSALIGSAS